MCSCHFRNGVKVAGPEIYLRNESKLFPATKDTKPTNAKKRKSSNPETIEAMVEAFKKRKEIINETNEADQTQKTPTEQIILEAELDCARREVEKFNETESYEKSHYTVTSLNEETVRMETGLPTKEVFDIVCRHVNRYKYNISYFFYYPYES